MFLFVFSECKTNFNFNIGSKENISTPNFPEYYGNNLNCTWQFLSSDNGVYLVTFHSFNIYSSRGNEDTFSLWYKYGNSSGTYLNDLLMISPGTVILVPGREMVIQFISGARFPQRGFLMQIERHDMIGQLCAFFFFLSFFLSLFVCF